MREALLILGVIAVLLALTAIRYRRQLVVGYRIWKTLKAARETEGNTEIRKTAPKPGERLVKCHRCGTWKPRSSAITLGTSAYCSSKCVEDSV